MRKTGIILLAFIYICSQLITVAWVNSKPFIHTISRLMYRLSEKEEGIDISITIDQYRSLKDDDEIWWQGSLYDIEEKSFHGNSVTLTIVNDEFETSLLNKHNDIEQNLPKHYPGDHTVVIIWKWLQHVYTGHENLSVFEPESDQANMSVDYSKYSLRSGTCFIIPRPPQAF